MKYLKHILLTIALILIGIALINTYGSAASKNSQKLNNIEKNDKEEKKKEEIREEKTENKKEEIVEVIVEDNKDMIETSKGMIHKNSMNTNDEGTISSSSNPKDITVSK